LKRIIFVFGFLTLLAAAAAMSQNSNARKFDSRLTVHTLLREDLFAGFISDNMDRFTQGEKNLELLLAERPGERAELLAWKGGARLYRGVKALAAGRQDEYATEYKASSDLFAEAKRTPHEPGGVEAIIAASYALFADKLSPQHRAAAWQDSYANYRELWKRQSAGLAGLPLHIKGELLAGMAVSAQRTGQKAETETYVDKIIELMPNSAYATRARQWKDNPASAAQSTLICQSCHEPGRLAARRAALPQQ
jgi:hypothetical protein